MAAKVETLRINRTTTPRRHGFWKAVAQATKRWAQDGQLGSSDLEMRLYTGSK